MVKLSMANLNGTLFQAFHWYTTDQGTHWQDLAKLAPTLAEKGFTALWLPPAYKASQGATDVGYRAYDLYDLGEFFQKGSDRTKYGTKADYLVLIRAAQAAGLQVYADVALSDKTGGDEAESVWATPVDWEDRNRSIAPDRSIRALTRFTFPGRRGTYSTMEWTWQHFDIVNHNLDQPDDTTLYALKQKRFDTVVHPLHARSDRTLSCDIDTNHPEVCAELLRWGKWYLNLTGVNGFRLDGVRHLRASFFDQWIAQLRQQTQQEIFTVADYWSGDVETLHRYITATHGQIALFDVPLHYNFYSASRAGDRYDMRQIFDGTLMQQQPTLAVTFVENHMTQPLQTLESPVEQWFKPLAYALILLRKEGYPCVFYGDYYGAQYGDRGREGTWQTLEMPSHQRLIDQLLYARRSFAYGEQYSYFDQRNLVGWTRLSTAKHPHPMAVVMSNGLGGRRWMEVGVSCRAFYDVTQHCSDIVVTNEAGWGEFPCGDRSVSVWLEHIQGDNSRPV